MVALRPDPLGRRLCQSRIGFERLMEDFHFPPFLVDCFNRRLVAVEVAARQIQNPGATVVVRKDLAAQQHGEVKPLEPSLNGFLFRPGQLVDPGKAALLFVFQCQRQRPVAFEGNDEVLAKALDDGFSWAIFGAYLADAKKIRSRQCASFSGSPAPELRPAAKR